MGQVATKQQQKRQQQLLTESNRGNVTAVKKLLQKGAATQCIDDTGNTPLHMACFQGHTEIVRLLLKRGAEANTKNVEGNNALHFAAYKGHADSIRLLVKAGVDLDARNAEDDSPLLLGVLSRKIEVVKVLVEANADISARNEEGFTPLHYGAGEECLDITRYLLEKNSSLGLSQNREGQTPAALALLNHTDGVLSAILEACPEASNIADRNGDTPLHLAVKLRKAGMVKTLMANGADATIRNGDGRTPIELAAATRRPDIEKMLTIVPADDKVLIPTSVAALTAAGGGGGGIKGKRLRRSNLLSPNSGSRAATPIQSTIAATQPNEMDSPTVQKKLNNNSSSSNNHINNNSSMNSSTSRYDEDEDEGAYEMPSTSEMESYAAPAESEVSLDLNSMMMLARKNSIGGIKSPTVNRIQHESLTEQEKMAALLSSSPLPDGLTPPHLKPLVQPLDEEGDDIIADAEAMLSYGGGSKSSDVEYLTSPPRMILSKPPPLSPEMTTQGINHQHHLKPPLHDGKLLSPIASPSTAAPAIVAATISTPTTPTTAPPSSLSSSSTPATLSNLPRYRPRSSSSSSPAAMTPPAAGPNLVSDDHLEEFMKELVPLESSPANLSRPVSAAYGNSNADTLSSRPSTASSQAGIGAKYKSLRRAAPKPKVLSWNVTDSPQA